jgi:hypothetical protein
LRSAAHFDFDNPVRFDCDHMTKAVETFRLLSWQQIPIIELRTWRLLSVSIAPAFRDSHDQDHQPAIRAHLDEAWVNTLSWPARAVVCRKDGSYILYNYSGGFSWHLYGPDNGLQHDIAGTLGTRAGLHVGTYDKGRRPQQTRVSV